jgi:hypothetical protein
MTEARSGANSRFFTRRDTMMIDKWLILPAAEIIFVLAVFFGFTASLLYWLSFSEKCRDRIQPIRGVTPSFFGSVIPILGILIGFLSNDVWDNNRKAADIVREEAAELTSLYGLVAVSDLPYDDISRAIRAYASAVVDREWPAMTRGEAAAEAEIAQDNLIRIASKDCSSSGIKGKCDTPLAEISMKLRETRSNRLKLSTDNTETIKWSSVLFLALIAQISVASVHLERRGPQIAAMTIFTSAVIVLLSLIALHELPFAPPLFVKPTPLSDLLKIIPESGL